LYEIFVDRNLNYELNILGWFL